tara:strand:+ start:134391 stop:135101 length:711 start_codon:yes stop_codon:yes gene_type:complete
VQHGGGVVNSDGQKLHKPSAVVTETVRCLVNRPGIVPGSRVLLCGISNTELIHELTSLGLLVTCTDEVDADSLQEAIPEAECCLGNTPRAQFDQSDTGFDLVVVPVAEKSKCQNTFSRASMMELAGRLACLQPGGFLVQLGGTSDADSARTTHSLQCCLRQVTAFPGRSSIRSFAAFRRLRFSKRSGRFAVSLQIPEKRLSPFEWDTLAMNASKHLPTDCCHGSAEQTETDFERAA